jgi:hypothetical protein
MLTLMQMVQSVSHKYNQITCFKIDGHGILNRDIAGANPLGYVKIFIGQRPPQALC